MQHYSSRWLYTTKFEELHSESILIVCTHTVDLLNIDVTESEIKHNAHNIKTIQLGSETHGDGLSQHDSIVSYNSP